MQSQVLSKNVIIKEYPLSQKLEKSFAADHIASSTKLLMNLSYFLFLNMRNNIK